MKALFLMVFFLTPTFGEYRAFLLEISPQVTTALNQSSDVRSPATQESTSEDNPAPPPPRRVLTTLDPDQYPKYYLVPAGHQIRMISTWMCRDRTNEKPICPDPKAPPKPASEQESSEAASPTNSP